MTVTLVKKENQHHVLKNVISFNSLVLDWEGRLFQFNYLSSNSSFNEKIISYNVQAVYCWKDDVYPFSEANKQTIIQFDGWFKTPPLCFINNIFAYGDSESELIEISSQIRELYRTKKQEVDRLEEEFLFSCRLITDKIT